jgi:hypothetical protein
MANQFTLRGHHVDVNYTIGGNADFVALTYRGEEISRDFKPRDIHTDHTAVDTLISVQLEERSSGDPTISAFFLPNIEVPQDETADFTTVGIHQEHVKRSRRPYRLDTWHPSSCTVCTECNRGAMTWHYRTGMRFAELVLCFFITLGKIGTCL